MKKEFMFAFQISKKVIFEVSYYTLGGNKAPYFSTSASEFNHIRTDWNRCGQAQKELLKHRPTARRFFEKWDKMHLSDLTAAERAEVLADLEELKNKYNYTVYTADCFAGGRSHIGFNELVNLSRETPKGTPPTLHRTAAGSYDAELTTAYPIKDRRGDLRQDGILHIFNIDRCTWGACFDKGMTDHTAPTLAAIRSYYGI